MNNQLDHQIAVRKNAETERLKAEAEKDEVYETFSEDLQALQE